MEIVGRWHLPAPHVEPPHHLQLLVSPEVLCCSQGGQEGCARGLGAHKRNTFDMQWFVEKHLLEPLVCLWGCANASLG